MNKDLKVVALQLDIAWTDVEQNLVNAERAIAALPQGCDVVVVPEMFTTGFIVDKPTACAVGEPNDGRTVREIERWAKTYNTAICGSFIATDRDGLYNRAFFIEPSGDKVFYDKRHLFSMSGENQVYVSGENRVPVFRFRGWNIAMAVCFDLRFPVWMRNIGTSYDLLIVMANWPDSRAYPWGVLLAARAIENQAYVVGCNRTGADDYGKYSGTSAIFDPKGKLLAGSVEKSTDDKAQDRTFVMADLSKAAQEQFREKFPVYKCMDTFEIR